MTFSQIDEDGQGLTLKDSVTVSGDLNITGTLGLFGVAPVAQQTTKTTTAGFTAGSGTAVNDDSTFTGDFGTAAYTLGSIVRALKQVGLILKDTPA